VLNNASSSFFFFFFFLHNAIVGLGHFLQDREFKYLPFAQIYIFLIGVKSFFFFPLLASYAMI
jgi:hypothetical protein